MKRIKLYTNEGFDMYIAKLGRSNMNEDRWDTLDFEEITTDIDAPSKSEIDTAVRELEILDDAIIENGAIPSVDANTGIIELDFDDKKPKKKPGRPSKKLKMKLSDDNEPVRELDLDSEPSITNTPGSDDKIRELDLDDAGTEVTNKRSNIGNAIGSLDYDSDVDTSNLIVNIEDVYVGLASSNGEVVQSLIKRYANDLTDVERLKEIMLTHAIQGNYDSLRAICGDMQSALNAKEKELGYINKSDVDSFLRSMRKVARSLTGANNTYGLIPNAIANCNPNSQIEYINIVDFLHEILNIPLQPIYYRGAFLMHCYDLADYLLDELEDIPADLLSGNKGLLKRASKFTDIPGKTLRKLTKIVLGKLRRIKSSDIGDLISICANDKTCLNMIKQSIDFSSARGEMILDYLEDNELISNNQLESLRA